MDQDKQRGKPAFQSGMTLEQYLRNMQMSEETIPTAETHNPQSEIEELEDNLYKTANVALFQQPNQKLLTFSIKEIEEENLEDSLDQLRDNPNVASTHFQKIAKQQFDTPVPILDFKKKELSPTDGKQKKFSPQKTFTKTFYGMEQPDQKNKSLGKTNNAATTLYGSKFTQVQKEKMKKVETDREREKKAMMKRKGRNTEMDWG